MRHYIPVIDQDGLDIRVTVIVLDVKEGVELITAIKAACDEYCQTVEGKQTYMRNCHCFNWGDFDAYVPNSICEHHGIRKVDTFISETRDFNEQLVDASNIFTDD
jgi:hypothetical protein